MDKKDFYNLEMGNQQKAFCRDDSQALEQLQSEIYDTSHCLPRELSAEYRRAIQQLNRIFVVRNNESVDFEGDLPTSLLDVEMVIAKYISECLTDCRTQIHDIAYIQSLLRDYEVVRFAHGQRLSVSLQRVHTILQDNFPDSYLCGLMNILIGGFMNTQTKVVTFF